MWSLGATTRVGPAYSKFRCHLCLLFDRTAHEPAYAAKLPLFRPLSSLSLSSALCRLSLKTKSDVLPCISLTSFRLPPHLQASATAASAWERGLVAAGTAGLAFGIVVLNSETAYAFSGKVDWEGSVRKDIVKLIEDEDKRREDGTGIGPTLIRLAWHSSGTYDCKAKNGGSNGATMRFCPEGNWGANQGLW